MAIAALPLNAAAENAPSEKERAREIRAIEKEVAKLQKRYDKQIKRCQGDEYNRPDARACDDARVIYLDVQQLKRRLVALAGDDAP